MGTKVNERLAKEFLASLAELISDLNEHQHPAIEIIKANSFNKLGFTDAGIETVAKHKYLVISVDFPLCNRLASQGIDVINFTHYRIEGWKLFAGKSKR